MAFPLIVLVALTAACSAGRAQDEARASRLAGQDYSHTIFLREAGECRFDPLTEHAFDGLLLIGGEPDGVTSASVVSLEDTHFEPELKRTPMERVPGGFEYRSQIELPEGSAWQGLPLARMWVEYFAPPETDSLYRRGFTFAASPEELRARLADLGQEVPLAPRFRGLEDHAGFTSGTCGGSIKIEAVDGGSALVCDRGC